MTHPTALVQRVLGQYQRRVNLNVILASGLGLGCLAALLWRLARFGMSPWGLGAFGGAGLAALTWWQGQRFKRERVSHLEELDRTLALQARLLTTVEFSETAHPPLLYPTLVQDTEHTLSRVEQRLPRLTTRSTITLLVMLALLLGWPWPRSSPMRLAMQTPAGGQPPHPPFSPPPEQAQEQTSQNQPQSQPGGGSTQSPQSQGGQQRETSVGQSSGQSERQQAGRSSETRDQGAQGRQAQDQTGSRNDTEPSSARDDASSASRDAGERRDSSQRPQQAQAGDDRSTQPDRSQQQSQSSRQAAQQRAKGSQRDTAKTGSEQDRQQGANNAAASRQGSADTQATPRDGHEGTASSPLAQGGGSSQSQDLLKADIQHLLKELSGELQTLQEELAARQEDLSAAPPGTTTDPELYGEASRVDRPTGNALPIQLGVDTNPTATSRRGGGVGTPSGRTSSASPQQPLEAVSLSEETTDEEAVHRQSIPPEYQPVFERLSPSQEPQ